MCRRQLLASERELREHWDDDNIGNDTNNNNNNEAKQNEAWKHAQWSSSSSSLSSSCSHAVAVVGRSVEVRSSSRKEPNVARSKLRVQLWTEKEQQEEEEVVEEAKPK